MKYNDLIPEFVVSDINISKDFYIDILGFKIEYERKEFRVNNEIVTSREFWVLDPEGYFIRISD